jgi:hypothetical protein
LRIGSRKKYREKVHDLAGAGRIANLGSQIQEADLVLGDDLRNAAHGATPWRLRAG